MTTTLNIYDELTLALSALHGPNDLLGGNQNEINPGDFGQLLDMVTDKFDHAHAGLKEIVECHAH